MVTPIRSLLFCIFMLIRQCQTLTETNHINLNTKASYIRKVVVADGSSADAATVNRKTINIRNVKEARSSSQKYRFLSWLGLLKLPDLSDEGDGSSFSPPELIAILPSIGSDAATNATQNDSITDADSSSSTSSSSSSVSGYDRTSSNSSSVSNGASSSTSGSKSSSSSSAAQVQSSTSTGYYVTFQYEENSSSPQDHSTQSSASSEGNALDSSLSQGDSTHSSSSSEGNEASSDNVNSKSSSSPKNSSQLLQAKRKESSSTVFVFAVLIAILSVGFLGALANHDTRERLLRTTGILNRRWQRNGKSVNLFYASSGSWLPDLDEPIASNNTANALSEDEHSHDIAKTNWRHIVDENISIFGSRINKSSLNGECPSPTVCPTVTSKGSGSKAIMNSFTADPWKSVGSIQSMASSTNDAWKSIGSIHLHQSSSSTQNSSSTGAQSQISLDTLISSAIAAPSPWKTKGKASVLPSPTGSNVTDCVSDHDNTEAFVRFRKILSTLAQPSTVHEGDDEDSCRNYALA